MHELDDIDPEAVAPQFAWMVWLCGRWQPGAQVKTFALQWLQVSWWAERSFAAEA